MCSSNTNNIWVTSLTFHCLGSKSYPVILSHSQNISTTHYLVIRFLHPSVPLNFALHALLTQQHRPIHRTVPSRTLSFTQCTANPSTAVNTVTTCSTLPIRRNHVSRAPELWLPRNKTSAIYFLLLL